MEHKRMPFPHLVGTRRLTDVRRRRTHQSGPLGELFDHGVDAVNTTLEVLLFAAATNLGQGWKTVLVLFACKSILVLSRTIPD